MHRPVHGRARHLDRECGTPVDPARSPVQCIRTAVGGQCLHADLRRVPAPWWPGGRPLRSAPDLPDRTGRLHRGQPLWRTGPEPDVADRRPHPAGPGCRDPGTGHPHHPDRHVRRGSGTGPCAGCMECRGVGGRIRGSAARRDPHRRTELALDPVRERTGRCGGTDRGPSLLAGVAGRPGPQASRCGRRGDGHRRTGRTGLCHRAHRAVLLGFATGAPSSRVGGCAARGLRHDRAAVLPCTAHAVAYLPDRDR